jgi:hypothetical protein
MKVRDVIHLIGMLGGAVLIVYGAHLIYPPSAYVVTGVLFVFFAVANKE